ncbi:uncharacterized protein LOC133188188 [Saccostrea echinata]|uniref:uncharacterized protein LOC133188188 n=1 Tax=Saccostrea echinata TaxID=191078 RepID=UPI002A7EEF33|nr:uncharacterized protein LOC133188188 [Saccostrea echinata]
MRSWSTFSGFEQDTTRGSDRYKIISYSGYETTWEQARTECRRQIGWDLVRIDNRKEDDALKTLLAAQCNEGGDGWFIGGMSENGGLWTWADGSQMTYTHFSEPSMLGSRSQLQMPRDTLSRDSLSTNTLARDPLSRKSVTRGRGPLRRPRYDIGNVQYAAILKEELDWTKVPSTSSLRMGYICERTTCSNRSRLL